MKLVNLTPHTVNICKTIDGIKSMVSIESTGIARVKSETRVVGIIDVIEETETVLDPSTVTGLPEPDPDGNTIFIVSRIVAEAVKGIRDDCRIPDKTIRDDEGQIIGCESLGRV